MSTAEPSKVATKLIYSLPPDGGVRAYNDMSVDPITGVRKQNFTKIQKDVEIENLRGKEELVTLDTAGFQFYSIPSKHKSFANDEEIVKEYYPESIDLIKSLTGATRVVLFNHVVRSHRPEQLDDVKDARQPAFLVHSDQTPQHAINLVHKHLPASDVPELLKHRFQIINLWRPIHHPAYDRPLALCDYRSVDKTRDTFPIALIYPDREGEMLGVGYNEHHKWKYLRGMTPDEILFIKCFDSVQDGSVATFTPHTAFEDPSAPADAALRESIELRAFVFYD